MNIDLDQHRSLARDFARTHMRGVPCRLVRGADGRQRAMTDAGSTIGVLVTASEHQLLEDAIAERAARGDSDDLGTARGVLLAVVIGAVVSFAAGVGIWKAGRSYERATRTLEPHAVAESRSSLP